MEVVELLGLVAQIVDEGQLLCHFLVELHELGRARDCEVVQAVAEQAAGTAVDVHVAEVGG